MRSSSRGLVTLIFMVLVGLPASSFAQTQPANAHPIPSLSRVPFVGCDEDGQTGPASAPKGDDRMLQIAPKSAKHLAYYQAGGTAGVLAPRGWHCFGLYGSNGGLLFVTPQAHKRSDFFSTPPYYFNGPVIQVSSADGETSGRFEVARFIARLFPAQMTFVKKVIDEGLPYASDFPTGPYPTDILTYRTDWVVEYQTPANSQGLGTMSRLGANNHAIDGVVIYEGPESGDGMQIVTMRLPVKLKNLKSTIINEFELENAKRPKN